MLVRTHIPAHPVKGYAPRSRRLGVTRDWIVTMSNNITISVVCQCLISLILVSFLFSNRT